MLTIYSCCNITVVPSISSKDILVRCSEIIPEPVQSPNTIQEDGTVCIPKNTLRQMYQEWLQFTKLRDECIVTMQEQLKQLKPANTSLFVDFCEKNLDITKQVFECETCGYEARNMKALSAHRKGKKCMDLRVLSDETTSHKDPNEKNVFKTLFNNFYFLIIFSFEMALTIYVVNLPKDIILSNMIVVT